MSLPGAACGEWRGYGKGSRKEGLDGNDENHAGYQAVLQPACEAQSERRNFLSSGTGSSVEAAFIGNPLTPHSLCEKMGISRPLASRLIENLEMKGFLEKEVSEADKRSYFLRITELGSRELKGTYAYYLEPVYLLRTQMGEEKFGLLAGLLCECNRICG